MTEEEKEREYQEADWLRETAWRWVLWRAPHPGWDHDHCFFCNAHICDKPEHRGVLRECWRHDYPDDPGNYDSVCASCFDELREKFRWVVLATGPEAGAA